MNDNQLKENNDIRDVSLKNKTVVTSEVYFEFSDHSMDFCKGSLAMKKFSKILNLILLTVLKFCIEISGGLIIINFFLRFEGTFEYLKIFIYAVVLSILLIILYYFDYISFSKKINRFLFKNYKTINTEYTFRDNGFTDVSVRGKKTKTINVPYRKIKYVYEIKNLILLYNTPFSAYIVQKNGFETAEDLEAFCAILKRKITKNNYLK